VAFARILLSRKRPDVSWRTGGPSDSSPFLAEKLLALKDAFNGDFMGFMISWGYIGALTILESSDILRFLK